MLIINCRNSKGIYSIYLFSFPFLIINIITNDFPTTGRINLATTLRLLNKGEYRGKCFELFLF